MPAYLWLAALLAHATLLVLSSPTLSAALSARAIVNGTVPSSVMTDSALLSAGPVSPLSTSDVDEHIPYGWFAQATYCPQASQADWSCKSCKTEPVKDFQVYASGGDGGLVQYWYVGWWPSRQSIIVAHEGTELNNTLAVLTDLTLVPAPLDIALFPGAPPRAAAHLGFQAAHKRTAEAVLNTVNRIIVEKGATTVVTVGHSLGGALALLDGLYLRLKLPSTVSVATRTFGQPRVGNDVFATFVDQKLKNLIRVTNKLDIVPVIPPVFIGYRHTSGEQHINRQNVWNACSGRDNLNKNCSVGEVWTQGVSLKNHLGPYAGGLMLGTSSCI